MSNLTERQLEAFAFFAKKYDNRITELIMRSDKDEITLRSDSDAAILESFSDALMDKVTNDYPDMESDTNIEVYADAEKVLFLIPDIISDYVKRNK